jgi:hypothetical protein
MNINNFLICSECNLIFPETFVYISENYGFIKTIRTYFSIFNKIFPNSIINIELL